MTEKKKKGLKEDLKIKITEFAEIPDGNFKFKEVHQEALYTYPKGYIPPDDFEPKPVKEENWYELFTYDNINVNIRTGEEIEKKPVRGPSPDILITDDEAFIEHGEEPHKVYKFEVIFVNLGDDYSDDAKDEIEHFIEEGLNRWNCMNASVMISDVRERIIDWDSEEIQEIYNRIDSTFEEWNKIFVQKE